MQVQCCVCRRVRRGRKWFNVEKPVVNAEVLSHGYCPACAEIAYEQIRAMHNRQVAPVSEKQAAS